MIRFPNLLSCYRRAFFLQLSASLCEFYANDCVYKKKKKKERNIQWRLKGKDLHEVGEKVQIDCVSFPSLLIMPSFKFQLIIFISGLFFLVLNS